MWKPGFHHLEKCRFTEGGEIEKLKEEEENGQPFVNAFGKTRQNRII